MRMKLISIILGLIGMLFTVTSVAASQSIVIKLDGRIVELKQEAFIENGSVMVPIRGVFEQVGIKVTWDGKDQTVTTTSKNQKVMLKMGSTIGYVNDKKINLQSPPMVKNNSTYVPLRFLITHSGFLVNWDQKSKTVSISSSPNSTNTTINTADRSVDIPIQAETKQHRGVKGKVLDSTGNPVSGATVKFLYLTGVTEDYSTTTLQDGTFTISELQPGTEYLVYARPPKGHPDYLSESYNFHYEGKEVQLPSISLEAVQVTGTVVLNPDDDISGQILISLHEIQPNGSYKRISENYVDEQSKYKLSGLTVGKEYVIYARVSDNHDLKSTNLDISSGNHRFVYQTDISNHDLVLSKPVEHPYIQLLGSEGTSIIDRNIRIHARDSSRKLYSILSGENGNYMIKDLKPGTSVTITVQIIGKSKYKAPAPVTVTYQSGELNLGIVKLLDQGPPQVTGMVQDEQGRAITRFAVSIRDMDTRNLFSSSTWSDSNGEFILYDLQPGHRYQIDIDNDMNRQSPITFDDYVKPAKYEFVYDPNMTTLPTFITPKIQMIGRVIEPDGTLLNANSRLYDANGTLISEFAPRMDRQFAVGGMREGQSYRVDLVLSRVNDSGGKLPKVYSHAFVYQPSITRFDDIMFDMDAKLPAELKAVRGKVVDNNGNPAAGIWVKTEHLVNGQRGSVIVKTNSSGEYVFHFDQPTQGEIYAIGTDVISSKVSFSVVDRDISVQNLIYSKGSE